MHTKNQRNLERTLRTIHKSVGGAAIITIGMRKNGNFDIINVQGGIREPAEFPDGDDFEEEMMPEMRRFKKNSTIDKGLSYIG